MKLITIPVDVNNFYRILLEVIKSIPPINKLRPKELSVLAEIMRNNAELQYLDKDNRYIIINSTENRRKMRKRLDMPEGSFNNNISILKSHRILTKENRLNLFFENIIYENEFKLGFVFKVV